MCSFVLLPEYYDTVLNCTFLTGSFAHLLHRMKYAGIEACRNEALYSPEMERWSMKDRALGRLKFLSAVMRKLILSLPVIEF